MKKLFAAICAFYMSGPALAQSVVQSGTVTPGHAVRWVTNGIVGDAGTATSPVITSFGVLANGPGICQQSATSGAYNRLCFSTSSTAAGFTLDNIGGATGGFTLKINGVTQGLTTTTLPVTSGNVACFSGTTGNIQDCGFPSGSIPGTDVTFIQAGTGAVTRTMQGKARDIVSSKDYATGDGATDDTAALNDLFSYAASNGKCAYMVAGTYKITAAFTAIAHNDVCIDGDGPNAVISYQGASTTPDIFTIGDGVSSYSNVSIGGFRVTSTVALTSGFVVHLKKVNVAYIDVVFDGQNGGTGNLWSGVWADNSSFVYMENSQGYMKNTGVAANDGVELHMQSSQWRGQTTGQAIHIGGGFGGLYCEQINESHFNIGRLIDLSLDALAGNNQIFCGAGGVFDTNASAGGYYDDNIASSKYAQEDAWNGSTTAGNAMVVLNWASGEWVSSVGAFYNSQGSGSGIVFDDPTIKCSLGSAVDIAYNTGFGIVANSVTTCRDTSKPHDNTSGSYSANYRINAPITAGTGMAFDTFGTTLNLQPASAGTIGGVNSITSLAHNWIAYIDTAGLPHQSQPAFSDLSGSATCAQQPVLTGDTTTSAGSCATTTAKVNAVAYPAGPSTNTVPVVTGANTITYEAVPNAALANSATTVNSQTCTLGSTCTVTAAVNGTPTKVALGADVNLTSTGTYFKGPELTQGSTGSWYGCGSVTVLDTAGPATFFAVLTDGNPNTPTGTVISSKPITTPGASNVSSVSLCNWLATPIGNLAIWVRDTSSTSGVIKFNSTGWSVDSTLSAFRIQ